MDQESFLAHVRAAAKQHHVPAANGAATGEWRPLAGLDRETLVLRFIAELQAANGRADRVIAAEVDTSVVKIAEGWGKSFAATGGLPAHLFDALVQAGFERAADAARANWGFSDAVCAVAETGSLMLASGPQASRRATLLPPRYLALVGAERIVPNLLAAVDLLQCERGQNWPASVTLVTGPSRTADIELSLTIGVHGPGEVRVLIVE